VRFRVELAGDRGRVHKIEEHDGDRAPRLDLVSRVGELGPTS
jgi:hypothetical protein